MTRVFAALLGLALVGCQTTGTPQRGTELNPIAPISGPGAGASAVLFINGGNSIAPVHHAKAPVAPVLLALQQNGLDVFRLDLSASDQSKLGPFLSQTQSHVRSLRSQGYRRVYVVGQSVGGFAALWAIHRDNRFADGVVAFAPAYNAYEPVRRQIEFHRELVTGASRDRRVAIFHFKNDEILVNWHADAVQLSRAALGGRPDAMVRVPELELGHQAALTQSFANRYGACLARFLAAERADQSVCPP